MIRRRCPGTGVKGKEEKGQPRLAGLEDQYFIWNRVWLMASLSGRLF